MDNKKRFDTTTVKFERVQEGTWDQIAEHALPGAVTALESLARELAVAKELAAINEVMRSITAIGNLHKITTESLQESLTNRSSGNIRVGVPSQQPENGQSNPGGLGGLPRSSSTTDRHRYRPSLSIGKGGFASQSSGQTNSGGPTGAHGSISRGDDNTTVIIRHEKYEDGTATISTVTYDSDGNITRLDWRTTDPSGATRDNGSIRNDDGGLTEYRIDTDKDGNITRNETQEYDANGELIKENDLAEQPGIDEGSQSDLAEYLQAWHRAVYGPKYFEIKIPAHFNPGTAENANANPSGPRIKHEGIAVNPDPNQAFGGGAMSKEAARRMKQELQDKAAGGFGPGGKPVK